MTLCKFYELNKNNNSLLVIKYGKASLMPIRFISVNIFGGQGVHIWVPRYRSGAVVLVLNTLTATGGTERASENADSSVSEIRPSYADSQQGLFPPVSEERRP